MYEGLQRKLGAIKCVHLGDSSESCLRILVSLPRLYQIVKQNITLKTVGPPPISIKLGQDAYVRKYALPPPQAKFQPLQPGLVVHITAVNGHVGPW